MKRRTHFYPIHIHAYAYIRRWWCPRVPKPAISHVGTDHIETVNNRWLCSDIFLAFLCPPEQTLPLLLKQSRAREFSRNECNKYNREPQATSNGRRVHGQESSLREQSCHNQVSILSTKSWEGIKGKVAKQEDWRRELM